MKVLFITSNEGKFREVREMGEKYGIDIEWHQEEYLEPQGSNLKQIATASAGSLTEKLGKPFIIEDSGLFIEGLKGFPGPYSSYVYKTIGNEGITKLVKDIDNRNAYFLAVVAYFDGESIHTFKGRVDGEITSHIRGEKGFGFDPVFLYGDRTFAEMSSEEKNEVS
ncbi:MAG: XTP/dITP diphosphatase, partial [Candidatus Hadarchaeota archaeon]